MAAAADVVTAPSFIAALATSPTTDLIPSVITAPAAATVVVTAHLDACDSVTPSNLIATNIDIVAFLANIPTVNVTASHPHPSQIDPRTLFV